jgi:8-oxo-dGTP pyrophosphatase MutT (NUDIX family)
MLMRRIRVVKEKMKRVKKVIEPVEAAGGVLLRENNGQRSILIIQRNGVWDLPKGKKESNESFEECAVREVMEETGIKNIKIIACLTETYHEYERNGRRFGKTTKWYEMETANPTQEFTPQREEGITEVCWRPVSDAKKLVGYENLVDVIEALEE